MDRRIRKTREAILNAFIELMAEKSFEEITISNISERADVNRGTIYLHFVDKFDLLDQCIEIYMNQVADSCLQNNLSQLPSKTSLFKMFEYLEQNILLYQTLFTNKGIPALRNHLMTLIRQILESQIDANGGDQTSNREIKIQFLASAIVGTLEWWITQPTRLPATNMVEQLWSLLEGIQIVSLDRSNVPESNLQPLLVQEI